MEENKKSIPIDDKDQINRLLDIFADAMDEAYKEDAAEILRYFKLVVNGKLPIPKHYSEIQIAINSIPVDPIYKVYAKGGKIK